MTADQGLITQGLAGDVCKVVTFTRASSLRTSQAAYPSISAT